MRFILHSTWYPVDDAKGLHKLKFVPETSIRDLASGVKVVQNGGGDASDENEGVGQSVVG